MRGTISNRSSRKPAKSARRFPKETMAQPDALGVATRLAAGRLRAAGIPLQPLLKTANLAVSQLDKQDTRIGVASQIKFLEIAAQALKDSLLGFNLAREGDLRQMGLLYYAAASSETLGVALDRAQRYSSIANESVVLKCFESDDFRIVLSYIGVTRIFDRQYMEFLMTTVIRVCSALTNRRLTPMAIGFVHQRFDKSSDLEKFFGCEIEFGADARRGNFPKESSATSTRQCGPIFEQNIGSQL
jgi:Arabinose-binding domain of AraC transcription regulator, N-term